MADRGTGKPMHSAYNPEFGRRICDIISTCTDSMSKICRDNPDFPAPKTINCWRLAHKEFSESYDAAKRIQTGLLAEELIDVARDSSNDMYADSEGGEKPNSVALGRSRLISDNTKWLATKLLPKIYGDRITADTTVHIKQEHAIEELE